MKYRALYTDRLSIESAVPDGPQIREMIGWLNDPITMRYSEQRHMLHTLKTQQEYIGMFREENLLMTIVHDKVMIGTISVIVDRPNNVADVGILIGCKEHWGKGFGLEAWSAVCDMTLNEGIRKIEAGCAAANISMMSICSRFDMIEEGRRDDHFLCGGIPIDLVLWGKFR